MLNPTAGRLIPSSIGDLLRRHRVPVRSHEYGQERPLGAAECGVHGRVNRRICQHTRAVACLVLAGRMCKRWTVARCAPAPMAGDQGSRHLMLDTSRDVVAVMLLTLVTLVLALLGLHHGVVVRLLGVPTRLPGSSVFH